MNNHLMSSRGEVLSALIAGGLSVLAAAHLGAAGIVLGPVTANQPTGNSGELLLAELNCIACHAADSAAAQRLHSRTSPVLDGIGSRVTPQFLRAWLTNPQAEKPGTPMPDLLHGLAAGAKQETVDALVHFLSAQTNAAAGPLSPVHQSLIDQGRSLYHTLGCVACHAPQESVPNISPEALNELKNRSVPLGSLAKKFTLEALATFLQDPLKTRPSGRMPSLGLRAGEARAIAAYLLREQAAQAVNNPEATLPGLHYEYYEVSANQVGDLDKAAPVSSGSGDQFNPSYKKRNEQFGLKFSGTLQVPQDATYTFFLSSDDGSKLWIDGQVVVDNDGIHAPQEKSGKVTLKAGPHSIALSFFNQGAGSELQVAWAEEGKQRKSIPAALLSHSGRPMSPTQPENLVLDAAKMARGRELFGNLGCASCHSLGGQPANPASRAPALAQAKADRSTGCLGTPKAGVPKYELSTAQRTALGQTLAQAAALSQPEPTAAAIQHRLAALNCYACHSREGVGGPEPLRAEFFTTVDQADLGDEGRIPPHLTGVGSKLQPEWLRTVLLNKGVARPYMATRMPQFGEAALGTLPGQFETADDPNPAPAAESPAPATAKFGRQLVGTGGVSCIACHTFGRQKSLGIPAMDLTLMTKRLKRGWFERYLRDPASLRPGTRMPSFWPDGRAANQDILAGDTSKQIEAIWAYLAGGRSAKLPEGLTRIGQELVSDKEAVIYRHFIEGAGSRAIGVGYPEKANLAFDANQLRLALIWHGKFIDAGKHRQDRGAGYEGPLGDDVVSLASGAPFARLASAESPWPDQTGKEAGYQMKGYRLDELQRPAFQYEFGGVHVEDYPIALPHDPEPKIKRTLTLKSTQDLPALWFRAGVGQKIEKVDGSYHIDGSLWLRFDVPGNGQPVIRSSGGKQELLVPIVVNGKEARLVEEIVW